MKTLLKISLIILLGPILVAEALAQSCNSPCSTPFAQNNGQDGIMFTISAKRNIVIDSFDNNFVAGAIPGVEIYYRYGEATAYVNNAGAWILAGSTGPMVSAGLNAPTNIPISLNIPVAKYQTIAFYITSTGGDNCRYTNGSAVCDSLGGSPDLVLHEGYGKDYPFGATFIPREFNGRVYYHCAPSVNYTIGGYLNFCGGQLGQTAEYYINPPVQGNDVYWQVPSGMTITSPSVNNDTIEVTFTSASPSGQVCAALLGCAGLGDTLVKICETITAAPAQADAGPDVTLCTQQYQLQGNAGNGGWQILNGAGSFGNPNVNNTTISGLLVGTNTLRWTVGGNGCPVSSDTVVITVKPIPIADFNHVNVCDGLPMLLQSTSYSLGGGIVATDWDVNGNGSVDYTSSTVNHTYPAAGNYQCTLMVTANDGCRDTIVQTVTVDPNPVVDYIYDPDCELSPMAFTDQTNIASGTLTNWYWTFGDGQNSSVQNPSHTYANDGFYVAKLTVTSGKGCQSSYSDSVEVFTIPTPDFIAESVCRNDTAKFVDASTSVQGSINFWEWEFDDGFPVDNNQNTVHKYAAADEYNVRLLVATDRGCTNTVVKPIRIYPVPVVSFTNEGVCQEQRVVFIDKSTLDNLFGSRLSKWEWEFGDGHVAGNKSAGNFYQKPGYYNVKLTPYSNYGCHDLDSTEVLIRPRPEANMLVYDDHVCAGNEIHFGDETYFDYEYDTIGVVDWFWTFGDGDTAQRPDPSHAYEIGGDYYTTMYVETSYGCRDSVQKIIVNYYNPVADFSIDTFEGCSPLCVTYVDDSKVADAEDLVYDWRFGNGNNDTEVNPTECYLMADGGGYKEYLAELTVTSGFGCKDSAVAEKPITVHANPIADFQLSAQDLSMLEPIVEIINYSEGGAEWLWNFGDSNYSDVHDPLTHEFTSPGSYEISLDVMTDYGCNNKTSRVVLVRPHQVIYVPRSFTPDMDGLNDFFEITGEDLEYVKLWVYDRWGHQVFYGENEDAAWDGRYENRVMPIGTYGYVIEYKQTNRIKEKMKGNLFITNTKQ